MMHTVIQASIQAQLHFTKAQAQNKINILRNIGEAFYKHNPITAQVYLPCLLYTSPSPRD